MNLEHEILVVKIFNAYSSLLDSSCTRIDKYVITRLMKWKFSMPYSKIHKSDKDRAEYVWYGMYA